MPVEITTDARGGEMRIETGAGRITSVLPRGDRRVGVVIESEEEGVGELVGDVDAYCAPEEVVDGLLQGEFTRRRVRYRFEVQRRSGVDVSIPLCDLSGRDRVRELAIVALLAEEGQ